MKTPTRNPSTAVRPVVVMKGFVLPPPIAPQKIFSRRTHRPPCTNYPIRGRLSLTPLWFSVGIWRLAQTYCACLRVCISLVMLSAITCNTNRHSPHNTSALQLYYMLMLYVVYGACQRKRQVRHFWPSRLTSSLPPTRYPQQNP